MAADTDDSKLATLEDFTLRQVVRITVGGDSVLLRMPAYRQRRLRA